jgi:hypothetical protein
VLVGVGPRPSLKETLVVFDHFWEFDRLVKDGAHPGEEEIMGSRPFCGIFSILGFMLWVWDVGPLVYPCLGPFCNV